MNKLDIIWQGLVSITDNELGLVLEKTGNKNK